MQMWRLVWQTKITGLHSRKMTRFLSGGAGAPLIGRPSLFGNGQRICSERFGCRPGIMDGTTECLLNEGSICLVWRLYRAAPCPQWGPIFPFRRTRPRIARCCPPFVWRHMSRRLPQPIRWILHFTIFPARLFISVDVVDDIVMQEDVMGATARLNRIYTAGRCRYGYLLQRVSAERSDRQGRHG